MDKVFTIALFLSSYLLLCLRLVLSPYRHFVLQAYTDLLVYVSK